MTRLDQGLKSCRAVISGYRALLAADLTNDNFPDEDSGNPDDIGPGSIE